MRTEALKKAQDKYDKANTKVITFKLNRKTDSDLVELLEKADNKQGLIKDALRQYIETNLDA